MKKSLLIMTSLVAVSLTGIHGTLHDASKLPKGDVDLRRQIVVEKEVGFSVEGHGRIDNLTRPKGKYTRVHWKGQGSTAVRLGGRNFEFKNLTLVNGNIHVPALKGFGTGNGIFSNVCFLDSTVIVGSKDWNGNADQIVFERCWFRNISRDRSSPAFQNTTAQNIQFVFRDCTFKNFETLMQINGGGHITLENCYFNECDTVFHVTGPGHVLGRQNSNFAIYNSKWDAKQKAFPTLVFDSSSYGKGRSLRVRDCRFNLEQFEMPNGNRKFVTVTSPNPRWSITLDGCDNIPEAIVAEVNAVDSQE